MSEEKKPEVSLNDISLLRKLSGLITVDEARWFIKFEPLEAHEGEQIYIMDRELMRQVYESERGAQ